MTQGRTPDQDVADQGVQKGGTTPARPKMRVKNAENAPSARRHGPVFLERDTYRQRRLIDAARVLPVIGAFLWMMPLLWQGGEVSTATAMMYIFGIWLGLVVISAVLSRRLRHGGDEQEANVVGPDPVTGGTAEGGERVTG